MKWLHPPICSAREVQFVIQILSDFSMDVDRISCIVKLDEIIAKPGLHEA